MFSDCGNGADEDGCTCNSLGLFSCADGTCLSKSLVCDGESHCSAGEDEADCEAVTKKRPGRCEQHQFWCSKTNKCIRRDTVCSSECGPDVCRCAKTTLPICPGIRSYPSPLRFLSDIEVMESDEYSAVSILLRTSCHPWLRELSYLTWSLATSCLQMAAELGLVSSCLNSTCVGKMIYTRIWFVQNTCSCIIITYCYANMSNTTKK